MGAPLTHSFVPFSPPRLVTLRLYGTKSAISRFVGLIGMSSPLHDVATQVYDDFMSTVSANVSLAKKVLTAYYECPGLNHPRQADRLTISYDFEKDHLVFDSRSHSSSASDPKSNLRLEFNGVATLGVDAMIKRTFPHFPLGDVRVFAVEGLKLRGVRYRWMLPKMKNLSHLRLDNLDISPALDALSPANRGSSEIVTNVTKTRSIHPRA